jgi:transposase
MMGLEEGGRKRAAAMRYLVGLPSYENVADAVQLLLARVLPEIQSSQQEKADEAVQQESLSRPVQEWRPAPSQQVRHAVATRRAERQSRYDQVVSLREQGLSAQHIAHQLGMTERTVRHWLQRGIAPDVRQRRKYHSDFDAYAPYVLKRWQQGCHRGMDLWREIAAQGYPGSYRMVYRFLETLQTTEQVTTGTHRLPQYPSKAAIWLFMRRFKDLDEKERTDLMAFRQASSTLTTTYELVQDFLQMVRHRQGDRLEEWLTQVEKSGLPELQSFAHGVQQDQAAVQAGLTLSINNGQVEGHVTKIKLIKRMMYGRANFPLLRQRVLQAL